MHPIICLWINISVFACFAAVQQLLFWRVTQQPAVASCWRKRGSSLFLNRLFFVFFKGWDKHAHVFVLHLVSKFLLRSWVFLQDPPVLAGTTGGFAGPEGAPKSVSDSRPNRQGELFTTTGGSGADRMRGESVLRVIRRGSWRWRSGGVPGWRRRAPAGSSGGSGACGRTGRTARCPAWFQPGRWESAACLTCRKGAASPGWGGVRRRRRPPWPTGTEGAESPRTPRWWWPRSSGRGCPRR